jgi:hypothetical protein
MITTKWIDDFKTQVKFIIVDLQTRNCRLLFTMFYKKKEKKKRLT